MLASRDTLLSLLYREQVLMWIQPSTRSSDLFQLRESSYLDAFPTQDAKVHRDSSPSVQEFEGTFNSIWRHQPIQEEKTTSQRWTEKSHRHDSPNRRRPSQIRTRDRLSRRLRMTRGAGAGRRSYKPSSFRSLGFRCRSYTAATIDCRGGLLFLDWLVSPDGVECPFEFLYAWRAVSMNFGILCRKRIEVG